MPYFDKDVVWVEGLNGKGCEEVKKVREDIYYKVVRALEGSMPVKAIVDDYPQFL